jgi:hypothetical protein
MSRIRRREKVDWAATSIELFYTFSFWGIILSLIFQNYTFIIVETSSIGLFFISIALIDIFNRIKT